MEAVLKFSLDLDNQRLWHGDQPVQIGNKAFQLLRLLVNNPDQLLSKDRILDEIWGELSVSESLVKEYIHDLRVALADDPKQPRFIETVRGSGYRYLGGIDLRNMAQAGVAGVKTDSFTPSLAVLPFWALSGDPVEKVIADSVSEDIVVGLSKNPYLSVVSGEPITSFDGKPVSWRDHGHDLGVQYMLKGSVRKTGSQIRITAQLIDLATDIHLWAESYDRVGDDARAVQDEVAGSIIHALGARDSALEKSARERSIASPNSAQGAYDYYLQAREHFYRPGNSGFTAAEKFYEQAIAQDPTFARAYSGLASLRFLRFKLFLTASFESIEQKTLDLALNAVRLDPDDYLGHWVLGQLYSFQGKHTKSLAEFEDRKSVV